MNLYVSHLTALRYWRGEAGIAASSPARVRSIADAIASVKDAKSLEPTHYGLIMSDQSPLHALVCNRDHRRYAKSLKPNVWSADLPSNAFRRIAPHLYVSSPEFVFVQMASQLSVVELAQLGNELCGGYFLRSHTGFGERDGLRPITTRAKLEAFVASVGDVRGAKRARMALRWVCDHCNSPMETIALLMLCLPSRMGGWQLPLPKVNKPIAAGKRLARYVGGRYYTPDFLWEIEVDGKTIRITAEYDSSDHHDEDADAQHTRIRRNDMKALGYLVTSINASQMGGARSFEYPARQIARDLGIYRHPLSVARLRRQENLLALLRRESFR